MAFKFTVDYQQLKLVIQTDSTEAVSLFEHLKTTVQYIDMQQIVAFQQLTAANVTIDADTLNRYFTAQYNSPNAESFSFTDSDVFSFTEPPVKFTGAHVVLSSTSKVAPEAAVLLSFKLKVSSGSVSPTTNFIGFSIRNMVNCWYF